MKTTNMRQGRGRPLSDGENKEFRGWSTQGQLSLRDMSRSGDKILERGTQGQLSLKDMSLSDDKILKRGTQLWSNSWGHVPN